MAQIMAIPSALPVFDSFIRRTYSSPSDLDSVAARQLRSSLIHQAWSTSLAAEQTARMPTRLIARAGLFANVALVYIV